jgi:hypothetical protein
MISRQQLAEKLKELIEVHIEVRNPTWLGSPKIWGATAYAAKIITKPIPIHSGSSGLRIVGGPCATPTNNSPADGEGHVVDVTIQFHAAVDHVLRLLREQATSTGG